MVGNVLAALLAAGGAWAAVHGARLFIRGLVVAVGVLAEELYETGVLVLILRGSRPDRGSRTDPHAPVHPGRAGRARRGPMAPPVPG